MEKRYSHEDVTLCWRQRAQRQGYWVPGSAWLQHFASCYTRKQEQVWSLPLFKTLQATFLSKTQEQDCVHFSVCQTVSSTGRGHQCRSLAWRSSEFPPHLQLENLLFDHQGNSSMASSPALGRNLLSHWDGAALRSILLLDRRTIS